MFRSTKHILFSNADHNMKIVPFSHSNHIEASHVTRLPSDNEYRQARYKSIMLQKRIKDLTNELKEVKLLIADMKKAKSDPLQQLCKDFPWNDECRVYDV